MKKERCGTAARPVSDDMETDDPIVEAARDRLGVRYLYPYQRLVVANIMDAAESGRADTDTRNRQIVILPTGAGKSLCFTLPAVLVAGITVVVFPLLALMSDQARRLAAMNIGYGMLRGGQPRNERDEVFRELAIGKIPIVLTNPETLGNERILSRLSELTTTHLVIDETHTVSEWGDTFRPAYLEMGRIVDRLRPKVVSAFTATASPDILARLTEIIFPGSNPHIIAANPDRPNISYRVIPCISKNRELEELLLGAEGRPAIVFTRSRTGAEMTARALKERFTGDHVEFYHAGLERDEKKAIEERFFASGNGILCATCAYGMGVDKRDIRTVIHRDVPLSAEAYLQESGRAGRDGEASSAVLLFGPEDAAYRGVLTGERELKRYDSMLSYAVESSGCRRERLLEILASSPEACFGCDVCGGTVRRYAEGAAEILALIGRHQRRFTPALARSVLAGHIAPRTAVRGLWMCRGFGSLSRWRTEDIEDAVSAMLTSETLRMPRRGPWRDLLSVSLRSAAKTVYFQEGGTRRWRTPRASPRGDPPDIRSR